MNAALGNSVVLGTTLRSQCHFHVLKPDVIIKVWTLFAHMLVTRPMLCTYASVPVNMWGHLKKNTRFTKVELKHWNCV